MTSLFTDGSSRALAATQPGVLTDRTFEWLFPFGFHCYVYSVTDSAQINSVRKSGLTIHRSL